MEVMLKYRGREVRSEDVAFINALMAEHPEASRRALSQKLCEVWDWRQPNGQLKDMVCRSLMLALHRAGHIELPPLRSRVPNNVVRRVSPLHLDEDTRELKTPLATLGPLDIREVRATSEEQRVNALLQAHHYLGYSRPVGEQLKYLVCAQDRAVAAFTWSSAPRHLGPRDRFIGWPSQARRENIRFLAYNARFLILPWVKVPHLASHLLGAMARRIAADWERTYAHPVYYLESFVEPGRFAGTCYRAANWRFLGLTTGRGKEDLSHRPNRPPKEVLGLPLCRDFRRRLCERP